MNLKQAKWQLRVIQVVMRRSREQGIDSPELRERSAQLTEMTALQIAPADQEDSELRALLASVRAAVRED